MRLNAARSIRASGLGLALAFTVAGATILAVAAPAAAVITKDAYIERADAICEALGPRDTEFHRDFKRARSDADRAEALQGRSNVHRRAARRLRALPDPSADRELADRFRRGVRGAAKGFERAAAAAARGDDRAMNERIDHRIERARRAHDIARRFGFERCG